MLRFIVAMVMMSFPAASPASPLVAGDIVVADPDSTTAPGRVIRVDAATGQQAIVAEAGLLDQPLFVAVTPTADLLVSDVTGALVRVDGQSGAQSKVADVPTPFGLTLAPNGYAYVTSGAHVVRVDPGSGATETVIESAPFGDLEGITSGPDGALYVVDLGANGPASGDERVVRVDPTSGAQQELTIGGSLVWPRGITFVPPGSLLVVDQDAFGLNGAVLSVPAAGGPQSVVSQASLFNNPEVAAAAPGGAPIYVTDVGDPGVAGDETLFRIDGQGVTAALSQNGYFRLPWGVAVVGAVTCGDGKRDPGEQCDTGALNGTAGSCCTAKCLFAPQLAAGSACDNGNDCSLADACTADGVCADGAQCQGVSLPPGDVRGAAKPFRIAVVLADASGTGKPTVEAVGSARVPAAGVARVASDATEEVTNHVMKPLKRRRGSTQFRAKFALHLTRAGKKRLADEGTLDVQVVVTVTDRTGAKTRRDIVKQWVATRR